MRPRGRATIADDLAKLEELRAEGLLTYAEFEAAKARLIGAKPPELDEDDRFENPAPPGPTKTRYRYVSTPTGAGRKWAIIVGLALGAVAVAALVVFVTANKSHSDHQASCQRYKDALTLAYTDDPTATVSTVGLSARDAAAVLSNERVYRQAYADPSYLIVRGVPDPAGVKSEFDNFIQQTIPRVMAEHGC